MNGIEELMTVKEVCQVFKVHRKTLARWVNKGKFPMPITVEGRLRWRSNEVWAYQQRSIEARSEKLAEKKRAQSGA